MKMTQYLNSQIVSIITNILRVPSELLLKILVQVKKNPDDFDKDKVHNLTFVRISFFIYLLKMHHKIFPFNQAFYNDNETDRTS